MQVTTQTPVSAPGPQASAQSVNAPQNAASLLDILQGFNVPSQLNQTAKLYCNTLIDEVTKSGVAGDTLTMNTDNYECRVFTSRDGRIGIPVIFAETFQNLDAEVPVSEKIREIAEWFRGLNGGSLLETIIVAPEDYQLVDKMAYNIVSTLKLITDQRAANITVENIRGTQFVVTTNISAVRSYISSRSPHEIPARDDIGLLVYAIKAKSNRPITFTNGVPDQDYAPILAVTGYTEFLSTTGAQFGASLPKYIPIVVITNIVSDLQSRKLTGAALAIAADTFIRQNRWLAPYSIFNKDAPNLGALVTDSAGKPCFVENIDARNKVLNDYMLSPFLALDITEGRARIAGIDKFVFNQPSAVEDVCKFLCLGQMPNPVVKIWRDFIGQVKWDGKTIDSRYIDYLNLATKLKDPKIQKFLFKPEDPKERNRQINELLGVSSKQLYTNYRVLLDAQFVNFISVNLVNHLRLTYDLVNLGMTSNISDLLTSNANQYGGFHPLGMGMGSNWSPTSYNPYASGF